MAEPFRDHREAAQAILLRVLGGIGALRSKEGAFLGQIAFDANAPTEKQMQWLLALLDRNGLPTLGGEAAI